jgi:phosphatidylglycerophosphate synthase
MARTHSRIIIDARPASDQGPWAERIVLGRPILQWHLDAARSTGAPELEIVEPKAPEGKALDRAARVDTSSPVFWLRTDRLYDPRRLARAYRRGDDSETAVLWWLYGVSDLESAAQELRRRLFYQPLGRYWAWGLARQLAEFLRPTAVRPNAVTVAATAAMIVASACLALGSGPAAHVATAALLALALVLDTADGHLARIQATASEFGRWLDVVLDELCDLVLHAAIAWSVFVRTGQTGWLILGLVYTIGKYLFQTATVEDRRPRMNAPLDVGPGRTGFHVRLRQIVHLLGHADVRWHAWILFALFGRLDVVLIFGAVYFPLRVGAILMRRAAAHE